MTLRSSLYVGSVMHRRLRPRMHSFRYRAFWFLLDLDELDELSRKLRWFSYNRSNIFSFYDADHGDGTATPIRARIESQLAEAQIDLAGGRICLLCMPRTLGYCFNPISIYFCYRADASLTAVVYQVHNTFGERHSTAYFGLDWNLGPPMQIFGSSEYNSIIAVHAVSVAALTALVGLLFATILSERTLIVRRSSLSKIWRTVRVPHAPIVTASILLPVPTPSRPRQQDPRSPTAHP